MMLLRFVNLAVVAVLALTVSPPIASSISVPYSGTLSIRWVIEPGNNNGTQAGTSEAAGEAELTYVDGRIDTVSGVQAGLFSLEANAPMDLGSSFFPWTASWISATNGAGFFSALSSGGGGTMPLSGVVTLCLFASCTVAPVSIEVPLSNGIGGVGVSSTPIGTSSSFIGPVWLIGAPWTVGSIEGGPSGHVLGGEVELVTSFYLVAPERGWFELNPTRAGYATLNLQFVPEPSSGGMLSIGLLALVASAGRGLRS